MNKKLKMYACALTASLAFAASSLHAQTLASEDFSGYETGLLTTQPGAGIGWSDDWIITRGNTFWAPAVVTAAPPSFNNSTADFLATGQGLNSGSGRIMRLLETPVTNGTVWFTGVLSPLAEVGEAQLWIGGALSPAATSFPTNVFTEAEEYIEPVDVIAGLRIFRHGQDALSGGKLAYFNSTRATTYEHAGFGVSSASERYALQLAANEVGSANGTGEVYSYFRTEENELIVVDAPIFYAIALNVGAGTVSYYIFEEGDDVSDPANATHKLENLVIADDRPSNQVLGMSMFHVQPVLSIGNIRVARQYRTAAPTLNRSLAAAKARVAVDLDTTSLDVWAASSVAEALVPQESVVGDDISATSHLLWGDNNLLHTAIVVATDEVVNGEDVVEIFLDGNLSRNFQPGGWPTNYDQFDDFQLIFTVDSSHPNGAVLAGAWADNPTGNPVGYKGDFGSLFNGVEQNFAGIDWQLDLTDFGYVLKVSLDPAILFPGFSVGIGSAFGYDVAVKDRITNPDYDANVENSPQYLVRELNLVDNTNKNWQGTSEFGVAFLQAPIVPIAADDFTGYTAGETVVGVNGGFGFEAWQDVWSPGWSVGATWTTGDGFEYSGNVSTAGSALMRLGSGGANRIGRFLQEPRDSGVTFISAAIHPAAGSAQMWFGNGVVNEEDKLTNSTAGLIAGIRQDFSFGGLQYIDPSANPANPETYVTVDPTAVYRDPYYVIIAVLHDSAQVAYHFFGPGNAVSEPGDADYIRVVDIPESLSPSFDAMYAVYFNFEGAIGPITIGDSFEQVTPRPATVLDRIVLVNEVPESLSIQVNGVLDLAWLGSKAHSVDRFWSDGGKNEVAQSPSDYSATAHFLNDAATLYAAVVVTDDEVVDGQEVVELYLDGDLSRSRSLSWPTNYDQLDDFQLIFKLDSSHPKGATIEGAWAGNPTGNPLGYKGAFGEVVLGEAQNFEGIDWAVTVAGGGYTLEVSLDLAVLFAANPAYSGGFDPAAVGKMGLDVAVIDRDSNPAFNPDDAEPAAEFLKSHYFLSDTMNWNWNGTANFATAFFLNEPVTYIEIDPQGPFEIGAEGGEIEIDVIANLPWAGWSVNTGRDWITADPASGMGDDFILLDVAPNTGLGVRNRTFVVDVRRITILQEGTGVPGLMTLFPQATLADESSWYSTWMGLLWTSRDDFPSVYSPEAGWVHMHSVPVSGGAVISYNFNLGQWTYSAPAAYPWTYSYDTGEWFVMTN